MAGASVSVSFQGSTQSRILNDIYWLGLIARPPDRQKVKRQWSSISYLNPTEEGIEIGTDSSKKGVALCQASEQLDQAVRRFEWISSAKISWDWEYTPVTILYSHELAKTSSVQLSLQCWDIKDCWAGVRGGSKCVEIFKCELTYLFWLRKFIESFFYDD